MASNGPNSLRQAPKYTIVASTRDNKRPVMSREDGNIPNSLRQAPSNIPNSLRQAPRYTFLSSTRDDMRPVMSRGDGNIPNSLRQAPRSYTVVTPTRADNGPNPIPNNPSKRPDSLRQAPIYTIVSSTKDVKRPVMSRGNGSDSLRQAPKYTIVSSTKDVKRPVMSRELTMTISIPPYWQEMRGRSILIADVNKGSSEWERVQQTFQRTLSKRILLIKRIQNLHHWETYSLTKRKMQQQSGIGSENELRLFHGTTPDLARIIESQNLDPRLSGKNGTLFGKGTYFAMEAQYSDRYAESDEEGHKFIFMARVLTGKFCTGDRKYSRPPQIDQSDPHSPLYDSCVDDIKFPSIYCIFHDSQFYIDYLIEYI